MNNSTAIFLINDKVRAVGVTYEAADTSPITIFKTMDPSIKEDDYVVVPTDTRHKMTVCKVKHVDVEIDLDSSVQIGWVVGKVDRVNVEKIEAMEADFIRQVHAAEKNRKREELRSSLLAAAGDNIKSLPIYDAGEGK